MEVKIGTWKHPLGSYDIVYPYNYNYVLNEPDKCKSKTPFLVLLIPTRPAEASDRSAIRETWGNETLIPGVTIIRLFFLGLPVTMVKPLQQHLEKESAVHHDIIQTDFLDTYFNLTIKIMTAMERLVDFCPGADYAMKVDADMFLNSEKLVKSLLNPDIPTRQNYFTGIPFIDCIPICHKDSKWYMPEHVFPGKVYPPFCVGPGYVFSVNVVQEILDASHIVKPVHLEDVYIVTIEEPLKKYLEEESSVYHDIIQRDFLDTYNNLTIKTMTSLEWLTDFCPEADYAMKVDADMFLNMNIEKLVKSLLNLDIPTRQNYFTGAPFIKARPIHDNNSTRYMPENVFPGQEYAPLCSGTGYVFSVNIVWKILEASYVVKPIHLEDVYIDMCLNFAQITITHPPGSFFNAEHLYMLKVALPVRAIDDDIIQVRGSVTKMALQQLIH
ncbi:beta-1,3-galactosyltransferase 2-like [Latimeria chalumnae]|uniref:beta-1,3-galactosyltransferase 2-like n=1 Tax=Latimeria chalumnae TaxID=7897 RepID=UPI00313EE4BA